MPRLAALLPCLVLVALLAGFAAPVGVAQSEASPALGRRGTPQASPGATTLQIDGFESVQGYRASLRDILTDIDLFWAAAFETAGARYASPTVTALEETGPVETGCGAASAEDSPAFYCPVDAGIYFAPAFFAAQEEQFGQFSWITILAHEWGHHVQNVLAVERVPDSSFELQADCLAGAFAQDTRRRGQLEPGDVTSAVVTSADAGDPPWLPQDQPGAHGTNDDRIAAFMRGYLDGVAGCNLPIAPPADGPVVVEDPPVASGSLAAALPGGGELPLGLSLIDGGARDREAIAATFLDPGEATRLLTEWGFRENAYRDFATDDGTLTIQVSLHRFATPDGAAAALPYYAEGRAEVLGLSIVAGARIGDQSTTVTGTVPGGTETTVYARGGDAFARVTLVSTVGDPSADATGLADAVVRGLGAGGAAPPAGPALADALPLPSQVPAGLAQVEDGARGLAEIAASFPDPDAEARLTEWGWQENAYRTFTSDDGRVRVEISLHAFTTADGAARALPYYAAGRIASVGVEEVPTGGAPIGDESVAVGGPTPAGNEQTVYTRRGPILVRVSAIVAGGDPALLATEFARFVVGEGG